MRKKGGCRDTCGRHPPDPHQTQSLPVPGAVFGVSTPWARRSLLSMERRSLRVSHAARSVPLRDGSQACMWAVCGAVCAGTSAWLADSVCARICATVAAVAIATNSRHSVLLIFMVKFSLVDDWPALCVDCDVNCAFSELCAVRAGPAERSSNIRALFAVRARGCVCGRKHVVAAFGLEAITRHNGKDDMHVWRLGMTSA